MPKTQNLPEALPVTDTAKASTEDAKPATSEKANIPIMNGEALAGPQQPNSKPGSKSTEIVSKRTANSETFDTGGGQMEVRQYLSRIHYKPNGSNKWEKIDTSLETDTNAAGSTNFLGEAISWVKGKTQDLNTYKVKANDWQAKFAASNDPVGMVRIESGGKTISFSPQTSAKNITPVISQMPGGAESVRYINLWPETDVVYTVKNEMLKEEIILKSAQAETNYNFTINGAELVKNSSGGFDVKGTNQKFTELSVTMQKSGPTSEKIIRQEFNKGNLHIQIDQTWLKRQATNEFPIIIDPSWGNGPTVGYSYTTYKSDGYVCSSSVCFMNAGAVYDNGWKNWRTVMCTGNLSFLSGKAHLGSWMHLQQANRGYLAGYGGDRYFAIQHANGFAYHGIDGAAPGQWYLMNYVSDLDVSAQVRYEVNRADWGPCWSLWGEEYAAYTYKGFDPDSSYMIHAYSTTPPTPTIISPQQDQTFIDPQVSFQMNPVSDADNDPVTYRFVVTTGPGGTGTIIDSGFSASTQWTVPDGVLQDGNTYYVRAYSADPYAWSPPSQDVKFKVDMRRGKDKTQSADTVGPVSIDLATGNVSTGITSHDTTALGGSLGVSLDYNSPLRSRNGLVGKYWNVAPNYAFSNGQPSGEANMKRVDKNIDFSWSLGSPGTSVTNEWFYVSWSGRFVVPVSGMYYFGGNSDDAMKIKVNNQQVYSTNICGGPCYGSGVNLNAGDSVQLQVDYEEYGGGATAKLYVKGAVAEQIVPTEWLRTEALPVQQNTGLQGRYYALNPEKNLNATDKSLFLSRVEPVMNINWGTGSPIPGGQVDFMSRWEGYITVPKNGTYRFKTYADDGTRLTINGIDLSPAGSWNKCCSETQFSDISLSAGKPYYIVADHHDSGGQGSYALFVETTDGSIPKQIIPSTWLSPKKQVLPNGWSLGIDPDGDLSYEQLKATTSSVTLTDSSGDTHIYTWTGSAYKPPVNEDGQLTRNNDGTFTLIDIDGKTYTFKADGQLDTVTQPSDDRKPAALKYSYANGRIDTIADGTDNGRWAKVYYYDPTNSSGKCNANPGSSFDSLETLTSGDRPKLYLCALETNDGRKTEFWYSQGNLARVARLAPATIGGMEATDYQYDQLGRMVSVRDSLSNDTVAAGVRTNDSSVLTEIAYDSLGRAIAVKAPAPTAGAARQEQTIEYLPYAMPIVRFIKPTGNVDRWVTTGSVPTGYTPESHINASLLLQQLPGTHALYSCLVGGSDQMVSLDANCEGQPKLGFIGYAYDNPQPNGLTVPLRRCVIGVDHFVSHTDNCEGFSVENIVGHAISGNMIYGQTKQHITGDPEPNGYTRKIEWDGTFRTVRDTDVTGKATVQEWDPVKDLLYSTIDATGLKSTTIYDANDMPVESYGPAPAAWFGADRKPLTAYATQVPKTTSAYDEGIKGLAVSWFDYTTANGGSLIRAPKRHTTGFVPANPALMWWDTTNPAHPQSPIEKSTDVQGIGFRATGKLTVPSSGTYTIGLNNDDAMRLSIDNTVVMDRWSNRNPTVTSQAAQVYLTGGKPTNVMLEYGNADNGVSAFSLDINGNGIASGTDWTNYLKPAYGLQTSQTVFGAPTADGQTANLVSTTDYGSNPELGLAKKVTSDATGPLKLEAKSEYEPLANIAAGAPVAEKDRFLRQTSSSLPGGATTRYEYYPTLKSDGTPADPVVNPCNAGKSYRQGGMLRLKTEPDPDGVDGPQVARTVETIYDDAGKVVATRYNQEPWTCTTYDSRERVLTTSVPAYNSQPARTIVNDYAVGGNPLITSSGDASGDISVETDLLGRNVKYTDSKQNVTTSSYDNSGRLTQRVSKLGTETYVYDDYDRLTQQKLDGITYATVTYDEFSRITKVVYPTGLQLDLTRESTGAGLGRLTKRAYTTATAQTLSDEVTRAVTGDVVSGTELGQAKTYSYDTAGRLAAATVAGNSFTYGYGAQDTSCTGKPGVAADLTLAGKDSNRTSQTVNGVSTTYCYDQADRLVASSNALYDGALYDSHGNTTRLGSGTTTTNFTYDSSDRNVGITETNSSGSITTTYARDVQGRLQYRHQDTNGSSASNDYYGYTASGDSPDFITDVSGAVTEKYLALPGDVLVTIRPGRTSAGVQTFSLPNIHGDIFATVNADGAVLGTTQTGPFGEVLSSSTIHTATPWNTVSGGTFSYVGQHQKLTESSMSLSPIQMGARVYIPGLGRFLSVDSMPGGTPNLYAYPSDPVNEFDLDGNWPSFKSVVKWTTRIAVVASFVPGPIGMIGSGVAAAGYLAQGQKSKAAAAMVGFIPGGKLVAQVAAKSNMASKIVTKTLTAQAKSKGVGVNSKLFGTHGKGVLNNGRYRIGWSKDESFVAWRMGQPGKHKHFLNLRTSMKWRGYK